MTLLSFAKKFHRNFSIAIFTLALCTCWVMENSNVLSAAEKVKLNDGERIVWLGNTLVERDQAYGYWETVLTCRHPKQSVVFRNLGWSGDTVFGHARAGFGSVEDGFRELKQQVESQKPTLIFVAYGMNESFAGEAGLPQFREGMKRLLDTLAATKARLVLVTPNPHENLGAPLPDPSTHNQQLAVYAQAIRETADARKLPVVDLLTLFGGGSPGVVEHPLTDNGIHFTQAGYWRFAAVMEQGLNLPPPVWQVELDLMQGKKTTEGTELSSLESMPRFAKFTLLDSRLPWPAPPSGTPAELLTQTAARLLKVKGLRTGKYTLKIDGQTVAQGTADEWATGKQITRGPEFDQVEKMRQTIVDKNSQFFYRWRPQNWTYLFGFRKHEQGQNAAEIPQFDPLISKAEATISHLSQPVEHTYTLLPAE